MQGKVLVLRALKVLLKGHVDGLQAEEGHREEDRKVVLRNDLHLRRVTRIHEHLQNLLDFLVREYVELVILDELVLDDALDFSRQRQACQLRRQAQAGAFGHE